MEMWDRDKRIITVEKAKSLTNGNLLTTYSEFNKHYGGDCFSEEWDDILTSMSVMEAEILNRMQ